MWLPQNLGASRRRHRLAVVLALGCLGLGLLAQAGPVSSAEPAKVAEASAPQVAIDNFAFGPATLTVPAGTTVTWTNRDDTLHTVTSVTKAFASPGLNSGETFSYTFATPGTYAYYCALHPRMTATVIVK
jgi:plastocyanin